MAGTSKDKKPAKSEAKKHLEEALARIQAAKKQQGGQGGGMADKSGKGHSQTGGGGRIFRTQGRGS